MSGVCFIFGRLLRKPSPEGCRVTRKRRLPDRESRHSAINAEGTATHHGCVPDEGRRRDDAGPGAGVQLVRNADPVARPRGLWRPVLRDAPRLHVQERGALRVTRSDRT